MAKGGNMHEQSESEHSSDERSDVDEMAAAYHQLVVESKKMAKHNKRLRRKLLDIEGENSKLITSTKTLEQEKDGLSSAYNSLVEKVALLEKEKGTYEENFKVLNEQLSEAKEANLEFTKQVIQLKTDMNKFSSGSTKLDKMLGIGQTNKFGLGYERTHVDQVSKQAGVTSTKLTPKVQGTFVPSKKLFSTNKVCHLCGVLGHVKRVCTQKKNSTTPLNQRTLSKPIGDNPKRMAKQSWNSKKHGPNLKGKQIWKPKKYDPKSMTKQVWKLKEDDPKRKGIQIVDKLHKTLTSQPTHPKIRKVWVRKGEIFPY